MPGAFKLAFVQDRNGCEAGIIRPSFNKYVFFFLGNCYGYNLLVTGLHVA